MKNKVTRVKDRIVADKVKILNQLQKLPIVQIACERAGIGRSTFYRWCQDDPEFAQKARNSLYEGKSMINDLAESQLISGIKDKSLPAISFWLKHNHPEYRNRVEVTSLAPRDELDDEQQKKIINALKLLEINGD